MATEGSYFLHTQEGEKGKKWCYKLPISLPIIHLFNNIINNSITTMTLLAVGETSLKYHYMVECTEVYEK